MSKNGYLFVVMILVDVGIADEEFHKYEFFRLPEFFQASMNSENLKKHCHLPNIFHEKNDDVTITTTIVNVFV